MSEPTGDQRPAPKIRRGQVVSFTREDPLTNTSAEGFGVVLGVGEGEEPVVIRPLSLDTVLVPATDVQPVAAGDVG